MKKLQLLAILPMLVTALNANAALIPGQKLGPKLTLTEAQIQTIKNEQHSRKSDNDINSWLTDDARYEQLEILLQERMQEVDRMTYFRHENSLDNALIFSTLAIQAWNPELKHVDVKTQIIKNIINFGFVQGFVLPTLSMIDMSYATGRPGFGILLNSMLAEITPSLAQSLQAQYGVPVQVNGRSFLKSSHLGRNGMWIALMQELGSEFFPSHQLETNKNETLGEWLAAEIDPMKSADKSMDHFMNKAIKSEKTFIGQFVSQNSNIQNIKSDKTAKKLKGIFSNASANEAKTCFRQCLNEIRDNIIPDTTAGTATGTALGGAIGAIGGPFAGATAVGGAALGTAVGAGLSVAASLKECHATTSCSGDTKEAEEKKKTTENEIKQKEEQQKQAKEVNRQSEELKKQQAEIKRQQDELKKQQNELKKQQEQLKKQQEELKKQQAEVKKLEELKKQEAELKKKQDELNKKEAELKKQEDENKKKQEDDEKKKKEEENEKKALEVPTGPKGKAIYQEEEKSGVTFEDIQKMKKESSGTPMAPQDYSPKKVFTAGDKTLIIKVMSKEVTAKQLPVNSIYPTSPNAGD